MKLVIGIDRGQGIEEIRTTPRSIVEWERTTKSKISDLSGAMGMEDLASLAWFSLRCPGTFNEFLETLLDVEPVADSDPNTPHLEASPGA